MMILRSTRQLQLPVVVVVVPDQQQQHQDDGDFVNLFWSLSSSQETIRNVVRCKKSKARRLVFITSISVMSMFLVSRHLMTSNNLLTLSREAEFATTSAAATSTAIDIVPTLAAATIAATTATTKRRRPDFYSVARPDRSGSAIHDMILAHAYGHAHNLTYGGACFVYYTSSTTTNSSSWWNWWQWWTSLLSFQKIPHPRRTTVQLLHELGLSPHVLDYACPDSADQIVNPRSYRDLDAALLTDSWQRRIHRDLLLNNRQQQQQQHPSSLSSAPLSSSSSTSSSLATQRENDDKRKKSYEIVVHIRRGDVNPCHHIDRYLPNSHYLRLIEQSIRDYRTNMRGSSTTSNSDNATTTTVVAAEAADGDADDSPVSVTIYSESRSLYESFQDFTAAGYEVRLDAPVAAVWRHMMDAAVDCLILSKSSFSYVPAVLHHRNNNMDDDSGGGGDNVVVVYTPFRHAPLPSWHVVSDDILRETAAQLQALVSEHCQARG